MKLNIKSLVSLALLFSSFITLAQIETNEVKQESQHFFFLQIGVVQPFFYGDNFAARAYDEKLGVEWNVGFTAKERIIFEGGFSWVNLEIADRTQIGDLRKSKIVRSNLKIGYLFRLNEHIFLAPKLGYTYSNFRNKKINRFNDSGNSLSLGGTVQYNIDKVISVYMNIINYIDYLNITTTPEIQDQFERTNSLNISLGLQFNLFR